MPTEHDAYYRTWAAKTLLQHDAYLAHFLGLVEEPHRSTLLHTFANVSPSTAAQVWAQGYRGLLQLAGWAMEWNRDMEPHPDQHIATLGGVWFLVLRHSPERQKEWAAKLNLMHPTDACVASLRLAS